MFNFDSSIFAVPTSTFTPDTDLQKALSLHRVYISNVDVKVGIVTVETIGEDYPKYLLLPWIDRRSFEENVPIRTFLNKVIPGLSDGDINSIEDAVIRHKFLGLPIVDNGCP